MSNVDPDKHIDPDSEPERKITTFDSPRPHMIIENFFTFQERALALAEIGNLERHCKDGLFIEADGTQHIRADIKKNKVINLDGIYEDRKDSDILRKFDKDVWGVEGLVNKEFLESKYPEFEYMKFTKFDVTQVSIYGDGDYYNFHVDLDERISFMTLNVMLCNDQPERGFTGGDFILKWKDDEKVIPFQNNSCIVFLPFFKSSYNSNSIFSTSSIILCLLN